MELPEPPEPLEPVSSPSPTSRSARDSDGATNPLDALDALDRFFPQNLQRIFRIQRASFIPKKQSTDSPRRHPSQSLT